MKILFVDDEEMLRDAIPQALRRLKHEVQVESCGLDALTWLQENTPDHIMLDVRMPDLTGLETLALLRVIHPTIKVTMMSGDQGYITDMLLKDTNLNTLTKPFTIPQLKKCLG